MQLLTQGKQKEEKMRWEEKKGSINGGGSSMPSDKMKRNEQYGKNFFSHREKEDDIKGKNSGERGSSYGEGVAKGNRHFQEKKQSVEGG